jgi:hypothetical protein
MTNIVLSSDALLASLMAQAEGRGVDLVTLRALVEESSQAGARRALASLGLDDERARRDMDELRELLSAQAKSTAVTLNKLSGQVTMNAEELAADGAVTFAVQNSQVAPTDTIRLTLASGNVAPGTYSYQVDGVAAGSFVICVRNISDAALSEGLVFNFSVLKGANS